MCALLHGGLEMVRLVEALMDGCIPLEDGTSRKQDVNVHQNRVESAVIFTRRRAHQITYEGMSLCLIGNMEEPNEADYVSEHVVSERQTD